jgi:diamine N-acetyltransferase
MSLREELEKLRDEYWENDYVKIKPLTTQADLIYAGFDCRLTEAQQALVNPFWFSIGRAYLFRDDHYPCIIYNASNEPVGFINLVKWLGNGEAYSWSFFIDKDHQGKGYGKEAARLAVQILKVASPNMPIKLSTERSNAAAQRLYLSLGFEQLTELDGDDLVFGL